MDGDGRLQPCPGLCEMFLPALYLTECFSCAGLEYGQHDLHPDSAEAPGQCNGAGRLQGAPLLRGRGQHSEGRDLIPHKINIRIEFE